jgi:phosphatidylethanolamine/phosphatidyl-N-methylethanolamine N-methyltransferase
LRIVQGDAAQLAHLLSHDRSRGVASIVSSLPLRSLQPATTRAIGRQLETLLESGGLLVQFTYDLRGTRARLLPRFRRLSSKIVWSNLPPARVEVFERV